MTPIKILLLDDEVLQSVGRLSALLRAAYPDFENTSTKPSEDYVYSHEVSSPIFVGESRNANFRVEVHSNRQGKTASDSCELAKQCVTELLRKDQFDLVLIDMSWGAADIYTGGQSMLLHIYSIEELKKDRFLQIEFFSNHISDTLDAKSPAQVIRDYISGLKHDPLWMDHPLLSRTNFTGKSTQGMFGRLFLNVTKNRRKDTVKIRVMNAAKHFKIEMNEVTWNPSGVAEAAVLGYLKLITIKKVTGDTTQFNMVQELNGLLNSGDDLSERLRALTNGKGQSKSGFSFGPNNIGALVLNLKAELLKHISHRKEELDNCNGKKFHGNVASFFTVQFE